MIADDDKVEPIELTSKDEIKKYCYLEKIGRTYEKKRLSRIIIETAKDILTLTSEDKLLLAEKDNDVQAIPFIFNPIRNWLSAVGLTPKYDKNNPKNVLVTITRGESYLLNRVAVLYNEIRSRYYKEDPDPRPNIEQVFIYGLDALETLVILNLNGYRTNRVALNRERSNVELRATDFLMNVKETESKLEKEINYIAEEIKKFNFGRLA